MRQESAPWKALVGSLVLALLLAACQAPTPSATPTLATPLPTLSPTNTALPLPSATPVAAAQPSPVPSPTPQACTAPGRIEETSLQSSTLEREIPIKLYFPPCYDATPAQPYPVLYLLHGFDADQNQWPALGLAEAADALLKDPLNSHFLIVMPYIAQPNLSALERNQAFFLEELMPYIQEHYPVQTTSAGRAIGGISRGASWALRLGLLPQHPFGRIGAHSLPPLAGEVEVWVNQLAALPADERPLLFIDIGNNDKDLEPARAFDLELTKKAIPHVWYMFAGYHDAAYWQAHLPIYLAWYAQAWPAP